MDIYKVTFAGHRYLERAREIEAELYELVRRIVSENEFTEFYVGDNGEFDLLATSTVRRVRRELGDEKCAINLVLPYKKANLDIIGRQFDGVIVPESAENAHPKAAIFERNMWLVDNCDLIICFVKNDGGAKRTLEYARKKCRIRILNIFSRNC